MKNRPGWHILKNCKQKTKIEHRGQSNPFIRFFEDL